MPTFAIAGISVNAGGDTIALTFSEVMTEASLTEADVQTGSVIALGYDDDGGDTNPVSLTQNTATAVWSGGSTIFTITLDEATDGAFIPDSKWVDVDLDTSVADAAGNFEAGAEVESSGATSKEVTIPTFTVIGTSVDNGGDTIELTFSEPMDVATLASLADITSIADSTDNYVLTNAAGVWTGLTVYTVTLDEATDGEFIADTESVTVTLDGGVTDLVGNLEAGAGVADAAVPKETTAPTVSSVSWTDVDGSTAISGTDTVAVTFSEVMDTSTIITANVNDGRLQLTNSHTFGTSGMAVSWNAARLVATITLGSDSTVVDADTIDPTASVTDIVGNADATGSSVSIDDDVAPTFTVAATSENAAGDIIALTFSEAMDTTTITEVLLRLNANITLDYSTAADDVVASDITLTTATVVWTGNTIATITLDEATDGAYIPDGKYIGVTLASVTDVAANAAAGTEIYTSAGVTAETTASTVTKIGTGLTTLILSAGATDDLVFDEMLTSSAKTAVQTAITAGANNAPSNYSWSGGTLTITAHATLDTQFADDVTADVTDLAGNTATSLLLVDSLFYGGGSRSCSKPAAFNFSPQEEVSALESFSFLVAPPTLSAAWKDIDWVKGQLTVMLNDEIVPESSLTVSLTNVTYTSLVTVTLPSAVTTSGKARISVSANGKPISNSCKMNQAFEVNVVAPAQSTQSSSGGGGGGGGGSSSSSYNLNTSSPTTTNTPATVSEPRSEARSSRNLNNMKTFKNVAMKRKVFNDVSADAWEKEYVDKVSSARIMTGYADGSNNFGKNDPITNAQIIKVGLESFGLDIPSSVRLDPLSDVQKDAWFAPYVQGAIDVGVTPRILNNRLSPNKPILRGESMRFLVELAGVDLSGIDTGNNPFADISPNRSFAEAVLWATENNIVSGYASGSDGKRHFGPYDKLTRGQFAKIVVNLLELLGKN